MADNERERNGEGMGRESGEAFEAYYEEPEMEERRPGERARSEEYDGGGDARGPDGRGDRGGDDSSPPADAEDWKDRYMRLLADFENAKRHAEAERGRLAGLGKDAVLDDLFPLVENMEMALKASVDSPESKAILMGVEMVYKQLLAVLGKHGVDRVETEGRPFDPRLHEALDVEASGEHEEGEIIREVRPGFTRQGKLLRPAAVVVAK